MLDQVNIIPITVVAAAVLLILTVLVGFVFKRKSSKTTILLLGATDAGKTALYTRLRFGKKAQTVTSMKENEGLLTLENKTFDLVDMPGHERVRFRYVDYLPVARAIVFVVDSTTVARQIRVVGEYLYNVLAQQQVQKERIPILIACNKTDLITALPQEKIQERLEVEINRLRSTRTAAVEQQETSLDDEQEAYLGYEGEKFKFEHLDNDVQFETCSVEKDALDKVVDWIIHI
ncbi:signal recognition particle receptor beta subunit-domain-containing protein [Zychaea mexicana]|uniref:signal recognition particle receptor beta subunit-domain-containing protein n=1 Tax=Zychaea mexicana TaxID=64656 RepID=UPI0022FE582A|nr:signal recognition particle receptor beta subunit-domain-containing protein [Zychaea mexicana]KAI9474855.1 signal recognition particle receptor beta subunit-domain-containing protein [Zychaea mexicana]